MPAWRLNTSQQSKIAGVVSVHGPLFAYYRACAAHQTAFEDELAGPLSVRCWPPRPQEDPRLRRMHRHRRALGTQLALA